MNETLEQYIEVPGLDRPFYVSNLGNCKNHSNKNISPYLSKMPNNKYRGMLTVKVYKNSKRTGVYLHRLIADVFLHEKQGYNGRTNSNTLAKKVVFKDGDYTNCNIDNLAWESKSVFNPNRRIYAKRRIRRTVFTKHIPSIIAEIEGNTTDTNKEENKYIIEFLNGDKEAIWKLYEKCSISMIKQMKTLVGLNYMKTSKKRKESIKTYEDFAMEVFLKIIGKIKTGRFDGRKFINWSKIVARNYLAEHFRNESKFKDEIHTFIGK